MRYIAKNNIELFFIIKNWLIFSSIACMILVSSCSPRSVRYNNQKPVSKTVSQENKDYRHLKRNEIKPDDKKSNNNKDNTNKIDEFANLIEQKNKTIDFSESYQPKDFQEHSQEESETSVPSLSQQLKKLSEEQATTRTKVDKLGTDVEEIKTSLSQIRRYLDESKTTTPTKGKPTKSTNTSKTQSSNSSIILPDEQVENEKKIVNNSSENALKGGGNFTIAPVAAKTPEKPVVEEVKLPDKVEDLNGNTSESIYQTAITDFERKDYSSAVANMKAAIDTSKDNVFISKCNYWLGEAYYMLQNFSVAIEFYRKTLKEKKSPYRDKAQMMIAESLLRLGNAEKARIYYQTLINENPNSEYIPKARKMLQQL